MKSPRKIKPTKKQGTTFQRPDLLQVLNRSSKYKYRWVNYNKIRSLGGKHPNGWELLTNRTKSEEEIIKEHALEGVEFVDGTIRRYELALAYMPVEKWRQLKGFKKSLADEAARRISSKKSRDGLDDDDTHVWRSK